MFTSARWALTWSTFCAALCISSSTWCADVYPSRLVELVVPYAPGGASDVIVRAMQPVLQSELGASIVVINRPGANGAIAGAAVARSQNDGYTLILADVALLLNSVIRSASPGYDAEKDFTHISLIGSAPLVLFGPTSGGKSLAEFLAKGKQKGVTIANAGAGSLGQLAAEMLRLRAAISIVNVPYKGSGLAINETIAGQVDATFTSTASGMPLVKSGQLRALAIASQAPSQEFPEIPTFAQLGIKDVHVLNWWGVIGPAGMAPEVVEKISRALKAAMEAPGMRERFAALGITPSFRPKSEFSALIKSDLAQWRNVVQEAGIKID
jgi:tripartite-type tricarboxylate transporter receptor subunit TctC